MRMIRLFSRLMAIFPVFRTKYCCICKHNFRNFLPFKGGWKSAPKLMIILDVIGSDLNQFSCPICSSTDRERHLFLYFNKLDFFDFMKGKKIFHFAPEPWLSFFIKKQQPTIYTQADLFPTNEDIQKMDIQNIPYKSESYDLFIANHILEHVQDDSIALTEIHRILKPGGVAILQTPYSAKLENGISDPGVNSIKSRLELYGQDDHVRLFGKNIFKHIESVGFESLIEHHNKLLYDIDSIEYGVNSREPLFLFRRL